MTEKATVERTLPLLISDYVMTSHDQCSSSLARVARSMVSANQR